MTDQSNKVDNLDVIGLLSDKKILDANKLLIKMILEQKEDDRVIKFTYKKDFQIPMNKQSNTQPSGDK